MLLQRCMMHWASKHCSAKRASKPSEQGAVCGKRRPEGEGEEAPPEAEIDEEEDFMEDDDYYQVGH